MARCLHISLLVLSAGMYACVVPPPLGLDQPDAGANGAPAILSIRGDDAKELAHPGPVNMIMGQGSATITLYDSDAGDTLYVQAFVDYTTANPLPPRVTCKVAPPTDTTTTTLERTLTCDLRTMCQMGDIGTSSPHFLMFEVYDREPTLNDPLPFRSMPSPGLSTEIDYLLTCLASPT
jgi:hypothetical protein